MAMNKLSQFCSCDNFKCPLHPTNHDKGCALLQSVGNKRCGTPKRNLAIENILSKAVAWFPYFREMLRMENLCRTVGFNDEQTATLIKGKPLEYSGELYSEEHRHRFPAENVTARIAANDTDKRKLTLKIDGTPIADWFKQQFEKVRQVIRHPMQSQGKGRGI